MTWRFRQFMCFQTCKDHSWSNSSVQLMELLRKATKPLQSAGFFQKISKENRIHKNHWYPSPMRRSGMKKKQPYISQKLSRLPSCFSLPLTFRPSTVFFSITSRRKPGGVTLGSTWQRPLGGFHFFIGYQRSRPMVTEMGRKKMVKSLHPDFANRINGWHRPKDV